MLCLHDREVAVRQRLIIGALGLGLAAPGLAGAVPVLELIGGVEPDRPFAGAAGVAGGDAAYQNPAAIDFDTPRFSLAVVSVLPALDVDLAARPPGYDVPASVRDARQVVPGGGTARLERRPLPTAELGPRGAGEPAEAVTFTRLGVGFPVWRDHLALGLTAVLPVTGLGAQRPFFVDEREQAFGNGLAYERLGDRLTLTTFSLAAAGRLGDHFALGVGVTLTNRAETTAALYIPDAGDVSIADQQAEVVIEPSLSPHAGVVWRVCGDERLRLAATVHLPSESTTRGESRLRFFDYDYPEGQDALTQRFAYDFAHEPLRVGFGLAGVVPVGDWTLEGWLDGRWTQWSAYDDRYTATPPDWSDVLDAQLGLRAVVGGHALAAGAAWAPSPVPEQAGRSNYVDNARVSAALGWRHRWALDAAALSAGVGVQGQRWLSRTHQKRPDAADPVVDELPDAVDARTGEPVVGSAGLQTNNPGFPGFSHGGWLWVVMASIGVEL